MEISPHLVVTVLLYLIVIVFFCIAAWAESRDIRCTEFKNGKCGPGLGCAYAAGRPTKGDDLETLLAKIRTTARYEVNSIVWRRAFIMAALIAFGIVYVTKKKLPTGFQLASAFLIAYIVIYLVLTLFQRWITDPALHQLDGLLAKVKSRTTPSETSS